MYKIVNLDCSSCKIVVSVQPARGNLTYIPVPTLNKCPACGQEAQILSINEPPLYRQMAYFYKLPVNVITKLFTLYVGSLNDTKTLKTPTFDTWFKNTVNNSLTDD